MLQDEINFILEKYKTVANESETGKYYKIRKDDAKKEPKLTSAQEEKLLAQTAAEKQKNKPSEDEEKPVLKPRKSLGSFEKYKLSQAKRFLKNNEKVRKMLSHMSGLTEKEAKRIVKKYS